ncbi:MULTISPECIES: PQQ-dependent dehydrogenase, methanol/ethanol family [unclassified Sphingomonas]|uniref:PQQ-dependent dehydrogenase, methanol/ethanol family n=1 Tax=unclassified Sphingomonas TaxID=196159 RepID=UPI0006FCE49B|nr:MULTISPECIES: PQQ-dependent dehydrogenase, methanol/ethanol family [unclassified Sphingomonas]KQX23391.1 alcohol dehydrogenase [Sphingomonas sp. Root1294]KQY68242.1 alcohol dehydrogenase [Sphingomonas sp. Root50]KRB91139.1 alcohol dehydrogenase [Sphingomonas sp. Root720]
MKRGLLLAFASTLSLLIYAGSLAPTVATGVQAGRTVDDALLSDEQDGNDWAAYGRTHSEQHYSPLTEVNDRTIGKLGLAWSMELPGVHSAATVPLAVDGVLYFVVDQSIVHAVDAVTGRLLWKYDPEAAKVAGHKLRHSWGPRGIAFWKGKVYVGTTDGRLIAIDARTGEPVWSTMTLDPKDSSAITGAPRVFDGMVIIGQAGADVTPIRGYVTAYDAETGKQRWRFYTVPGDPAKGFEDDAQRMAAKTWTGEWWKMGGGGTAWNAITYDPDFDTVYIGTGNGAPWNQKIRSPGGGDNLFLSSVVALDAKTGKYRWHYQENPGNTWDYNSVMDITLADLTIGGQRRKVLIHAPKNGFVYVIDRKDGKLLSAEKFSKATWAKSIDLSTGRPIEDPDARFQGKDAVIWPASSGAHSWQPQSFNPRTGLVYIPTMELMALYSDKGIEPQHWRFNEGQVNLGVSDYLSDGPASLGKSTIQAWDPVNQRKVWERPTPGIWNGGTMTTAGNLLFQGQADGKFVAYAADSGKPLWSFDAKMGINGAPITYRAGKHQYVTVVAGWGSSGPAYMGSLAAQHGWVSRVHTNRVVTFRLDGKARLPANLPAPQQVTPLLEPSFAVDDGKAQAGRVLYARTCLMCHGAGAVAGGFAPDLRASQIPLDADAFRQVVHDGALLEQGMPVYDEFSDRDLENLRHYLRWVARNPVEDPKTPAAKR